MCWSPTVDLDLKTICIKVLGHGKGNCLLLSMQCSDLMESLITSTALYMHPDIICDETILVIKSKQKEVISCLYYYVHVMGQSSTVLLPFSFQEKAWKLIV